MVQNLTRVSAIKMGKESGWGTAVAPSFLLPITSLNTTHNFQDITDEGLRGVAAQDFSSKLGVGQSEVDIEGWVYPDEFGLLLLNIMGTVSSTASTTAADQHNYTLGVVPPSLTFHEDRDGLTSYNFPGTLASSMTIRFTRNDGALTWAANYVGSIGTASTDQAIADLFSSGWCGWQATMSAGGATDAKVMGFEMTIERPVTMIYTANNSQAPATGIQGPMRVTGRYTVNFDSDAQLNKYINATNEAVQVIFTNGSSGTDEDSLTATMSSLNYHASPLSIGRDADHFTLEYNFRALYNSTNTGPVAFTLKNATASY
jgi:hypothetical protein